MTGTKKTKDTFANLATIQVTESAANTLTFKKLETGISLNEKVAWIIHRMEFIASKDVTYFNTSGDKFLTALTTSSAITTLDGLDPWVNPAILDLHAVARRDIGTAASGYFQDFPEYKDFTSLPGGGLIVPPTPLYLGAQGVGLATALATIVRIWYTLIELTVDEYWQLVEARRVLTS